MNKFNQEHLIGILCILIAIAVMLMASTFPKVNQQLHIPGPSFFPYVLSCLLIVCGVYQIIVGFVGKEHKGIDIKAITANMKTKKVLKLFAILGLILFFILAFEFVGFIPCIVILLVSTMKLLNVRWLSTVIATVILTGLIMFLFGVVFHISLPSGLLYYLGL
ncbi:MAG: tripartite tricarboxylate transporter TctB family protein [Spirochaetales bacterium]|nr:tripartite tricarboxylate transporter TctB family protein [Spirochaetales bacterium]